MKKFKLSLGKRAEPDDDLDFPDFDFDNPEVKDDRKPVTKVALSAAEGFKESLTDKDKLRRKLLDNLPREYGEAYDLLDSSIRDGKEFIDDSIKSLKPAARSLAKAGKSFLPANFTRLQAKLDKIEKWASESASVKVDIEANRTQEIAGTIGRIFQEQQEVENARKEVERAEDDAKDKAKEALEFSRHRNEMRALDLINKAVTQTANYTTKVNAEWQKKTLELQYRILFANRDILESIKQKSANDKTLLESIAKNTALPDYRKLQLSENFFQNTRNKALNKLLGTVDGYTSRVMNNFKDNVKSAIDMTGMAASMLEMGADMNQMMESMGEKKTLSQKAGKWGGALTADALMSLMMGKAGQKLRNDPKVRNSIAKWAGKLRYSLDNRDRLLQMSEYIDDEHENVLLRSLGQFTRANSGRRSYSTDIVRQDKTPYGAGVITNQFTRSVTEIIPGYLSRILREITVLRTGDNKTSLVNFDHKSGRFMSEKTQVGLVQRQARQSYKKIESSVKPLVGIIEKNTNLTDEEKVRLNEFFIRRSLGGDAFTFQHFSDVNYLNRFLPIDLSNKVSESIKAFSNVDNEAERARRLNEASRYFNNITTYFDSNRGLAQSLADVGQDQVAKKAGVMDKYGRYNLDSQIKDNSRRIKGSSIYKERTAEEMAHLDDMESRPSDWKTDLKYGERPSDILLKEQISNVKGSFLEKLKGLNIKHWKYREGTRASDGGKPHIGPMAQDVKNRFGTKVAPGGTKIDMVNMNGILTGAVQELNDKVEQVKTSQKQGFTGVKDYKDTLLEQIEQNTKQLSQMSLFSLGALGSIDLSKIKDIDVNQLVKNSKEYVRSKAKAGYDYIKDGSLKSNLHGLANAGLEAGNSLFGLGKEAAGFMYDSAKKANARIWSGAKWTWNNPLAKAREYLGRKKEDLLEKVDVFVKGEDQPRLFHKKIAKGDYFDTSKPDKALRTRADIMNIESEIKDRITGETVLYKAELNEVFFRHATTSIITKGAKWLKSKFDQGTSSLKSFIPVAYGYAWNAAKSVYNSGMNLLDPPRDVYVKGEQVPRLFKFKMVEGFYFNAGTSNPIKRPGQITGMVYDKDGQVVLSREDFEKGLIDAKGQPISNPVLRAIKTGMSIINKGKDMFVKGAKAGFNKAFSFGKNVLKTGATLATHGLSGVVGGIASIPGFSFESTDYLRQIRDILDARLPGGGGAGYGGVSTDEDGNPIYGPNKPNVNAAQGIVGNTTKIFTGGGNVWDKVGGVGKSLFNKAKGFFGKSSDSEEGLSEEDKKQNNLLKNIKDKTGKKINELEKKLTLKEKLVNLKNKAKEGFRSGSWQSMQDRENVNKADHSGELGEVRKYETKNIYDLAMNAIKGVKDKLLGFLGFGDDEDGNILDEIGERVGRRGKRRPGSKSRLRRLKNYKRGKALGRLAGRAGRFLGSAGTLLAGKGGWLARAGLMSSALMTKAGTAIAATGSAIASAGALPVIAGAAAVAGTAYIGYKLYKKYQNSKWDDIELIRMLEYGFRGGDTDIFAKISALEELVLNASNVSSTGEVDIDANKLDSKEVYELFKIDIEKQDEETLVRKAKFDRWYRERFWPILNKWTGALYKRASTKNLKELPKQKTDIQIEIIEETSASTKGISVEASPLGLKELNTSSEVISNFRQAVLKKLRDKAKSNPDSKKANDELGLKGVATAAVAANFQETQKQGFFTNMMSKANELLSKTPILALHKKITAMVSGVITKFIPDSVLNFGKKALDTSKEVISGAWSGIKGALGIKDAIASTNVTTLEAIKFKAYGLLKLEPNKVQQLRMLEQLCSKALKFSSSGTADFTGNVTYFIEEAKKIFAIEGTNTKGLEILATWFVKRFLPVYLNYYSGMRNILNTEDFDKLSTTQVDLGTNAITLARELIGNDNYWSEPSCPWIDQVGSTVESSGVKEYLRYLEKQDSHKELSPRGFTTTNTAEVHKAAGVPTPSTTNVTSGSSQTNQTEAISNAVVATSKLNNAGADFQSEPEAENDPSKSNSGSSGTITMTAKSAADAKAAISTGSAAGLKQAGGQLHNGSEGFKYIQFSKSGVTLDGLNPELKRLFLGMAEEYGKLTGKKLVVTEGFRSTARQAQLYKERRGVGVARPGTSNHEYGIALDVDQTDLDTLDKMGLLRKYGFVRPISNEPWHIESVGFLSHNEMIRARTDHAYAASKIQQGIGRGGGGIGSRVRRPKGSKVQGPFNRNWDEIGKIFNANITPDKQKEIEETKAKLGSNPINPVSGSKTPDKIIDQMGPPSSMGKVDFSSFPEGEADPGKGGSSVGVSSTKGFSDTPFSTPTSNAQPNNAMQTGPSMASNNSFITGQVQGGSGLYASLPHSLGDTYQGNKPLLDAVSKALGVDPNIMAAIAAIESGFRTKVKAATSSATGLYQFIKSTWDSMLNKHGRKFGIPPGTPPTDARANALLGGMFLRENANYIGKENASAVGLYMAHFLGPGGAKQFFNMPAGTPVAGKMPKAAAANKSIFYTGGRPRTKEEIIQEIYRRLKTRADKHGLQLNMAGGSFVTGKVNTDYNVNGDTTASSSSTQSFSQGVPTPMPASTATTPSSTSSSSDGEFYNSPIAREARRNGAASMGVSTTSVEQPIQVGSDPSRNFTNGLSETNKYLSQQVTLLTDIKNIASQIAKAMVEKTNTNVNVANHDNIPNADPHSSSSNPQKAPIFQYSGKPLVTRQRVSL